MSNYYNYNELKQKALKKNASQEDVNALGRWFEAHGHQYWNGKAFLVEKDLFLKPVYKPVYDNDAKELSESLKPVQQTIIGFEFVGVQAPWFKRKAACWEKFSDEWFEFYYCTNCGYRTMETSCECPACKAEMKGV